MTKKFRLSNKLELKNTVALHWDSEDANDYYYGVRANEVRDDRPSYAANDGLSAKVRSGITYVIDENWSLRSGVSYTYLSREARHSPLVKENGVFGAAAGVSYKF